MTQFMRPARDEWSCDPNELSADFAVDRPEELERSEPPPDVPLRVLVVYNILQHYRYDVFKELEKTDGFEVEYVAGTTIGDGSIATIPPIKLGNTHLVRNIEIGPLLWQAGLTRVLRERKPDIVVFLGNCKYLTTWLAAAMLRARHRGVLFWTIGWHRPERGWRRLFRLAFYHLADHLLLYSDGGKAIGLDMGFPDKKMTAIYNSSSEPIDGVSKQQVDEFARQLPPKGQLVALAVIRLNPVKQLDMLLTAAQLLRARGVPLQVLIVGDGPQRERLLALAASVGVPLFLPGAAYSEAELRVAYDRSTITVVPTRAGLTTLQSFKYGLPVVTHDYPYEQMPESEAIEPGVTGDFYSYGSVTSLADVMEFWIQKQLTERTETSKRCKEALTFRWCAAAQARAILVEASKVAHKKSILPYRRLK